MNSGNSPMDLDPALANKLFQEGAFLIIAGVPVCTQFGIDLCSYTVGENFRGVKMIPPGTHYVWCASQGTLNDTAPRVGFVHFFKNKEIVVREWDHESEELRERQILQPEVELERIRENLRELDRFLAPYDFRFYKQWKNLVESVSEETVKRCRPELATIRTNMEFESCPDSERPRGTLNEAYRKKRLLVADENDLLPDLKPREGTGTRFTTLPERVPRDSNPTDISRHCIDCVEAIETLRKQFPKETDLIEEIQLAFVFFLVGHSLESLAHWRKILQLLSHSETAVEKYKLLYMKYSEILSQQLPFLPEELMEPTERNTVYKDVRSLLINLNHSGLKYNATRLSTKLQKEMMWSFIGLLEVDPDDLPTVVET